MLKLKTNTKFRSISDQFQNPIFIWMILAISILLTVGATFVSRQLVEQRLFEQFTFRSDEISTAIVDRLSIYERTLWAGVALFYATPSLNVERQQWASFVEALHIGEHFPGIQGLGYSVPLTASEKLLFEKGIRAQGFEEFSVKPAGKRELYSSIVYLEPFDWRNKRAFGYDMWSNPMRQEAMRRARDMGVAATSGIITLVQETSDDVQRGFLTYVPVYRGGEIPKSLELRKRDFLGWVYAPFRVDNLMMGILGSNDSAIIFDIYDGTDTSEASRLFSSSNSIESPSKRPEFVRHETIQLQGRTWTIKYSSPPGFTVNGQTNLPQAVMIVGTVISMFLFVFILSLYNINRKATDLAKVMTSELRTAKEGLEAQIEARTDELEEARNNLELKVGKRTSQLQEKVEELEIMNKLTSGRELRVIELKQEVNSLALQLNQSLVYDTDDV